jgi:hypothetical protein
VAKALFLAHASRGQPCKATVPVRLLRTISGEQGWAGFRQPARKRLHGLPASLRYLM